MEQLNVNIYYLNINIFLDTVNAYMRFFFFFWFSHYINFNVEMENLIRKFFQCRRREL